MLVVADRMLWAILGILFGRIVHVMTKLHGDVSMNAPSWARTYIPGQCSYSRGIVMVSPSNIVNLPCFADAIYIALCTNSAIHAYQMMQHT